ncbi:hypothetical protein HAX54_037886 [Datura stramonium]|uniref:ABC transmembrane type-1 domain-containing protein n=1 Tax=Datura stramonium TaxID=4076 RepID=A0ABS8VN04_DATST|nr:hypothetical protein [Datura stramonium]
MKRSTSHGSSRHSFTLNYPVPGLIDIHEAEIGDEDKKKEDKGSLEKRKKVSIWRLFKLNEPELPYLLLGSLAAIIHGLGEIDQRIRFLTFKKVVHQEISWFDDPEHSSGAVGARLSTDASTVRTLMGDALGTSCAEHKTVVAGLVIAFTANWILAIIILLVLPLIGVQGFLQTKLYKGFSADAKVMYEEASQIANDAVGSIRTVASFCAEKKVMDMYQKKCEGPMKQGVKIGIDLSLFIMDWQIFGQVFKVFFALTLSAVGVTQSTGMAPDATKAKDSVASIFDILDRNPKIDSNVQIFKDLCLTVPSGKTVALVGESGREINCHQLNREDKYCLQQTRQCNRRRDHSSSKISKCTQLYILVCLKDMIHRLERGFNYQVDKSKELLLQEHIEGSKDSLLDEATSALDAESERIVQEALDRVMVNRTTVVVAHRLTTIKGADVIAVVKNGVIAEKGRHDVLLNIKDGVYASLVALHMTSA